MRSRFGDSHIAREATKERYASPFDFRYRLGASAISYAQWFDTADFLLSIREAMALALKRQRLRVEER